MYDIVLFQLHAAQCLFKRRHYYLFNNLFMWTTKKSKALRKYEFCMKQHGKLQNTFVHCLKFESVSLRMKCAISRVPMLYTMDFIT